jgi:hypothetical protein
MHRLCLFAAYAAMPLCRAYNGCCSCNRLYSSPAVAARLCLRWVPSRRSLLLFIYSWRSCAAALLATRLGRALRRAAAGAQLRGALLRVTAAISANNALSRQGTLRRRMRTCKQRVLRAARRHMRALPLRMRAWHRAAAHTTRHLPATPCTAGGWFGVLLAAWRQRALRHISPLSSALYPRSLSHSSLYHACARHFIAYNGAAYHERRRQRAYLGVWHSLYRC